MSAHAITLHLPETLYERFLQRARWSRRSLETELLEAVAAAAPAESELPPDLLNEMDALGALADDDLWLLARQAMPFESGAALEALHVKQQGGGLSPVEDAERARLLHEYERTMLIRAQAAKLLKDRGHDVSKLLTTL